MVRLVLTALLGAGAACTPLASEPGGGGSGGKADDFGGTEEQQAREREVADRLEAVREDPAALAAFLDEMPKGADLHSHLSGEVAAESLIAWGGQDGLCVRKSDLRVVSPPCTADSPALAGAAPGSGLHDQLVQAWSMEGFTESSLLERHAHFFDTFGKFEPVTRRRTASMIAEARRTAARHHVEYLELMLALGSSTGGRVATSLMSPSDPWDDATLEARRAQILATADVSQGLAQQRARLDDWEAAARSELDCGGAAADPGCDVEVRYLVQTVRTQTREAVFGAFVWGFELARLDPRVVGLNLVQAEENPISLASYQAQMQALDVLHRLAPVHVSLHAGELIPALLPAGEEDHLTFHIRRAVEVGHAERIGHGVALATEDDSMGLLREMAERGVLVEICLTSNQQLLDVAGPMHPLGDYLAAGVPVALATDDEGVLRSSLSREAERAVTAHGLSYPTLKAMVRQGLEAAFLAGDGLRGQPACAAALAAERLDDPCRAFLEASPKAGLQWRLEADLAAFEEAHRP